MPKRTETNQALIVMGLRKAGATVQDIHVVGFGCPDILVGYKNVTYVMEIKYNRGKLNDKEKAWHLNWRGQVAVVKSVNDALEVIGAR